MPILAKQNIFSDEVHIDLAAFEAQKIRTQTLKNRYTQNESLFACHLRFAKWACDQVIENADFGEKISSFQMKLILILAGM